ncbi:hypothetical protein EVG20_g8093 [Dentipellis fragilis]|uniref:Uncharacterized protein n=1 Tax=Dentipellis fragilis TaxID=205917 RepID=A0A4Y9Y8T2_9AGAM|nr:hypothetical protein EVG20_g8093 [Dentipellis fragilis]
MVASLWQLSASVARRELYLSPVSAKENNSAIRRYSSYPSPHHQSLTIDIFSRIMSHQHSSRRQAPYPTSSREARPARSHRGVPPTTSRAAAADAIPALPSQTLSADAYYQEYLQVIERASTSNDPRNNSGVHGQETNNNNALADLVPPPLYYMAVPMPVSSLSSDPAFVSIPLDLTLARAQELLGQYAPNGVVFSNGSSEQNVFWPQPIAVDPRQLGLPYISPVETSSVNAARPRVQTPEPAKVRVVARGRGAPSTPPIRSPNDVVLIYDGTDVLRYASGEPYVPAVASPTVHGSPLPEASHSTSVGSEAGPSSAPKKMQLSTSMYAPDASKRTGMPQDSTARLMVSVPMQVVFLSLANPNLPTDFWHKNGYYDRHTLSPSVNGKRVVKAIDFRSVRNYGPGVALLEAINYRDVYGAGLAVFNPKTVKYRAARLVKEWPSYSAADEKYHNFATYTIKNEDHGETGTEVREPAYDYGLLAYAIALQYWLYFLGKQGRPGQSGTAHPHWRIAAKGERGGYDCVEMSQVRLVRLYTPDELTWYPEFCVVRPTKLTH